MPLDKPNAAITEDDLRALITNSEGEQKTIDYKKAINLDTEKAKDEFRADITSFANSVGGHYVIGMEEVDTFPTKLCGQEIASVDAFKQRLEEVLQTRISPRIPSYDIRTIPLSDGGGKYATVIQVGRSYIKPHQITVNKNDYQFWARDSRGKYRLTVDELRTIILRSDAVADHVRRFRMDRVASIKSGDTPTPIRNGAKIVLHLVPLSSFEPAARYDLSQMHSKDWITFAATMADADGSGPQTQRYNLDGYLGVVKSLANRPSESYVQIFRNGIIEYVDTYILDNEYSNSEPIWHGMAETKLYEAICRGLRLLQKLGVPLPVAALLTLVDASECRVASLSGRPYYPYGFGRDVVLVPEELIEDYALDLDQVMKPILDAVWNAGGFSSSHRFDENGKFIRI